VERNPKIDQPRTWIMDLDGTVVVHNGHLNGGDALLPGVLDFFENLPKEDVVIIVTARDERFKEQTLDFLRSSGLRFDHSIFGVSKGERILVNDKKPDGCETALCVNLNRNQGLVGL
jgi:hypothetical protein